MYKNPPSYKMHPIIEQEMHFYMKKRTPVKALPWHYYGLKEYKEKSKTIHAKGIRFKIGLLERLKPKTNN